MSNIKLIKKMIREAISNNSMVDKIIKRISELEVIKLNITYEDLEDIGWAEEPSFHGDKLELAVRRNQPQLWGVDSKTNDTYVIADGLDAFGSEDDFIKFYKDFAS